VRRLVVHAKRYAGTGGVLGGQGRATWWWRLTLECGHQVERRARYKTAGPRGGWVAHGPDDVLPASKHARCELCKSEADRAERG
jgi:hypothetical protein